MNLKTIINLFNPSSFWRMESFGGNNIYDDYSNVTLINHNCQLDQDGPENSNLSNKSVNLVGGYLDHSDTGYLNTEIANQTLHISFNFKCETEITGTKPIISKWYPENQWFIGFENGILVAKIATDAGVVQVEVNNKDVLFNNRWNHCSFIIYNNTISLYINGMSQFIDGVTSKTIAGSPVIGTTSLFMVGGDTGYTWTQDFFITDIAITEEHSRRSGKTVRPLYILTRDLEDRFLDLAPEYYFNVYESFIRGNTVSVNKGTKGETIKGYLSDADLATFSVVKNHDYHGQQMVKFPTNGSFKIGGDLELNMVGDEEVNVIINGSFSGYSVGLPNNYLWVADFYGDNIAWRNLYREYYDADDLRAYTYLTDAGGSLIQDTYTQTNDVLDEYSESSMFLATMGKTGNVYSLFNTSTQSSSLTATRPAYNVGYNPPTDYNYTFNRFWYAESDMDTKLPDRAMGALSLIQRKLNPYEFNELQYPESEVIYNLLREYGDLYGWYSAVTDSGTMKEIFDSNNVQLTYQRNLTSYIDRHDGNTNRLNTWTGSLSGSVSSYLRTNISTESMGTQGFIWNMFVEPINPSEAFTLMSYTITDNNNALIEILCNSQDGVFSAGNIEVKFGTSYTGSFSTTDGTVTTGGYHMITLVRNQQYFELWINGKLEATHNSGEVIDIEGAASCKFYTTLEHNYLNDWMYARSYTEDAPEYYKEMIEFMLQGYHHKVIGTTYLTGVPIQSNIHTIDSKSLQKVQTNITNSNGTFSFDLIKSNESTGKYLMSLPVNELDTSNVVVHGPYETSVTYDQITTDPLIGETIYAMTLDFEPTIFYPMDDTTLPILDHSGNGHDATGFEGSNYTLDQAAFHDNSTSIKFFGEDTRLAFPTSGLFNNPSSTGLTINLWMTKNITQTYAPMVEIASTVAAPSDRITIHHDNATTSWKMRSGGGDATTTYPLYQSNSSWHMITLRINPNDTFDFLINGKVVESVTMTTSVNIDRVVGFIGWINNAYNTDSNLSNFSTFDYPLPNEELEKMANKGHGRNANTLKSAILYDTPVAYYTFDLRKQLNEEISNYDLLLNGSVDYSKNAVIVNKDVVGNNYMYNSEYKLDPVLNGGSIEFSFKTTGSHTQSIIVSEWNESAGNGSYKFQLVAGDKLRCFVFEDAYYMESSALTLNVWHLVILTIVNGNVFNLYIDDVLMDSLELLPVTPAIAYDAAINALNPVAYYRFDGVLPTMTDEGTTYDGLYENSPDLSATGLLTNDINTAVYFDGTNNGEFTSAFITELQTHSTGSVSFLVSIPVAGEVGLYFADSTTNNQDFQLKISTTAATFAFKLNDAVPGVDNFIQTSTRSFTADTTYHVAFVQDAVEGILLYIDGSLESTSTTLGTVSNKWFADATNVNTGNINYYENDAPTYYSGTIDELTFYSDKLTESEISELYKSSKNIAGGSGTPSYGVERMTIGSDSQGDTLTKLASPTWIDDLTFYHKVLSEVRRNEHYDYFINKKHSLIGNL